MKKIERYFLFKYIENQTDTKLDVKNNQKYLKLRKKIYYFKGLLVCFSFSFFRSRK